MGWPNGKRVIEKGIQHDNQMNQIEKIGRKRAVDMITTRLEHQSGFASKAQNIDDIPPHSKKTSLELRNNVCFEHFGLIIVSWNSYTRQSDVAVERPSVIL